METINEELLRELEKLAGLDVLQEKGRLVLQDALRLKKLELVSDEGRQMARLVGAIVRYAEDKVLLDSGLDWQMKGP